MSMRLIMMKIVVAAFPQVRLICSYSIWDIVNNTFLSVENGKQSSEDASQDADKGLLKNDIYALLQMSGYKRSG